MRQLSVGVLAGGKNTGEHLNDILYQLYSRTKLIAEKFLQIAVRESGCLAVNFVKQYK